MAMPDRSSRGISFLIAARGIFCFVTSRNTAMRDAAMTARYSASSPEVTPMRRTKGARVPKIAMDAMSIQRALVDFFIKLPLFRPETTFVSDSNTHILHQKIPDVNKISLDKVNSVYYNS